MNPFLYSILKDEHDISEFKRLVKFLNGNEVRALEYLNGIHYYYGMKTIKESVDKVINIVTNGVISDDPRTVGYKVLYYIKNNLKIDEFLKLVKPFVFDEAVFINSLKPRLRKELDVISTINDLIRFFEISPVDLDLEPIFNKMVEGISIDKFVKKYLNVDLLPIP